MASVLTIILLACLYSVNIIKTEAQSSPPRDACLVAFQRCDFRFSGDVLIPTISLNGPFDSARSPRIVFKRRGEYVNETQFLGIVNTNEIPAEIIFPRFFLPISVLQADPRFSSTHVKPFTIPYTSGSGVGYETLTGNQKASLSRRCIRLFFTDYQVLDADGTVTENVVNVPRFRNKCVVFRTA